MRISHKTAASLAMATLSVTVLGTAVAASPYSSSRNHGNSVQSCVKQHVLGRYGGIDHDAFRRCIHGSIFGSWKDKEWKDKDDHWKNGHHGGHSKSYGSKSSRSSMSYSSMSGMSSSRSSQSSMSSSSKSSSSFSSMSSSSRSSMSSSSASSVISGQANVNIANFAFNPTPITVKVGTTVKWTNQDSAPHTVTRNNAGGPGPFSGDLAQGATYSYTFNQTGTYNYHCYYHPGMQATVVVVP